MNFVLKQLSLIAVAMLIVLPPVVEAAEPAPTVMTVSEMCGGCVKKISARLAQMPEVADVTCDVAAKSVTVTLKAGGVSARTLWEAMDEIGKTPVKLVDGSGTYTEKPQN